jgi:pentatricopeptide repeat protein
MRWAVLAHRSSRCGGGRRGHTSNTVAVDTFSLSTSVTIHNPFNWKFVPRNSFSLQREYRTRISITSSCSACYFRTNGSAFSARLYTTTKVPWSNLEETDLLNADTDIHQSLSLLSTVDNADDLNDENLLHTNCTINTGLMQQLYDDARRLRYNLTVIQPEETNRIENWEEVEYCLRGLSNARTIQSVELSWSLVDAVILSAVDSSKKQTDERDDDPDDDLVHAQLLFNWDLWYSIIINWHQVSKELLNEGNGHTASSKNIISPIDLLARLDQWKAILDDIAETLQQELHEYKTEYEHFDCTNCKTLSLLLDIVSREGKFLANQPNSVAREIVPYAEFAEKLLLRMMEKSEIGIMRSEVNFPPSTANLNMVLILWARAAMVDRAWRLLQYAITSQDTRPDLRSYNAVMQAYSIAGDGKSAERVLYELLRQQQKQQEQFETDISIVSETGEPDVIKPSILSWNTVLAAWARSPDKVKAAERVEQLLGMMVLYSNGARVSYDSDQLIKVERMDNTSLETATQPSWRQSVKPDIITLNTALSAWARVGEADTCARLLGEMRDLYKAGQLDDPPDIFSYSTVMNAFAKARQPEKAEALWDGMYQAFTQGAEELKPTVQMMTTILDGYSRQISEAVSKSNYEAAFKGLARAERIFERIRELFLSGQLSGGPDTAAYNVMLKCYLYCARAHALPKESDTTAKIADELLLEMKKLYESKQFDAAPTFVTYSIVIQAWLSRPDGIPRAIALLDEALERRMTGDPRMRPDLNSITSIVTGSCSANQPRMAQRFLLNICEIRRKDPSNMVEPRIEHFGTIFAALNRSNAPYATAYAQNLFDQMRAYYKLSVITYEPDSLIYESLLSIWANSNTSDAGKKSYGIFTEMKRRAADGDKSMQPDLKIYHQVLFALSGKDPQPVMAENIVSQMYSDYKNNNSDVKPDNRTFNYALSAWARLSHPEAINRADALFQEMQKLHQAGEITCDVVTFNIMLHCLASSSKRDAAERAETLLQRMNKLADSGHETFRPTVVSYGCLINAWIRVMDIPRAEAILVNMYRESENGKAHLKPQVRHFEQVSRAWMSSSDKDKKSRNQAVLNLLKLVYPSAKRSK